MLLYYRNPQKLTHQLWKPPQLSRIHALRWNYVIGERSWYPRYTLVPATAEEEGKTVCNFFWVLFLTFFPKMPLNILTFISLSHYFLAYTLWHYVQHGSECSLLLSFWYLTHVLLLTHSTIFSSPSTWKACHKMVLRLEPQHRSSEQADLMFYNSCKLSIKCDRSNTTILNSKLSQTS